MDTQSVEGAGDVDIRGVSSRGEEIGNVLNSLELNIACLSEKVANLSMFVMHLETLGVELEGLVLDKEDNDVDIDCVGKFLEFDLLCGVLDSEVRALDGFLGTLHAVIADTGERVSSCNLWYDKLCGSGQCLKQSEEQFEEIKKQFACFERTLSYYKREGNGNVKEGGIILFEDDDQSLNGNTVINMQTLEQQRNVLRMLEKSLANEMDLEKNFNDSRKIEEKLKQRMVSLEQELIVMEEEVIDVWERCFEADNAREILTGISKELLGRLQISQFNLNGLRQHESELRTKLERSIDIEQMKGRNVTLDKVESSVLNDKVCLLEKQLNQYNVLCSEMRDMEKLIVEFKENVSNAESHANTAEVQCKLLTETTDALNKKLALLKDGDDRSKRVELLERQLKESDFRLQHAVASAEASQEKQNMLYTTIKDMKHVIEDLKSKVLKAENRADSAEEKCIVLSETNADLNEELSFLRSRLECLEGSLNQVEEAKVATAKDIGKQTKVFKNLLMQLAVERDRLNKQLSSLASENKILVVRLKQTNKDPSHEVSGTLATDHKMDRTWTKLSPNNDEVRFADFMPDAGAMRRIDAGVLSFKHLFILSVFVLLVSAVTYLYFDYVNINVSL
ncbi:hypothetical protein RJT34_18476 [Clitoria ternatea]|uniref:WIT1/2 N-terminal helical bundle domain-containing protein n=1 Tax=Clitoria ternatea TaxID=43366 RepID=A0AAN9PEK9_CLITE